MIASSKRDGLSLCPAVGMAVVSVALIAATVWLHRGAMHGVIMWDEADYTFAAEHGVIANALNQADINFAYRHGHAPLSVYAIGWSTAMLGFNTWSIRLPGIVVSALSSCLALWIGYDLARGSRRGRFLVGLTSACLLATAPAAVLMTTTARPHPFVVFFLLLNIWSLCRYLTRPTPKWAAVFGLTLAGQFVAMEYGPIVVVLSLVAIGLVRPRRLGLRRSWPYVRCRWLFPFLAVHRHVWLTLGSCLAGIALMWPAGLYKLGVLLNFTFLVRYGQGGHRALFRDQIYQHVPKYAYGWWYGTQYPLLLLGMIVGLCLMVVWAWRDRRPSAIVITVFAIGLAGTVHASHIMELSYSLFMIPPLALGGPLAGGWLVRSYTANGNSDSAVSHRLWISPARVVAAAFITIGIVSVLGGQIRPVEPNDNANAKLVAISGQLARLAEPGDQVLAQAWPVVRYALRRLGRSDMTVHPYDPANYQSDQLQQRFDAGRFDWVITAGSTTAAAPDCPLLGELRRRWAVVAQQAMGLREYCLFGPAVKRRAVTPANLPHELAPSLVSGAEVMDVPSLGRRLLAW